MMQALEKEHPLELDPEELKQMSWLLAETLLGQLKVGDAKTQLTSITYVYIREEEIIETVNLDLIASSTLGITDILGEIADWISAQLDAIASYIIGAIESFVSGVQDTLRSAIDAITPAVRDFIDGAVATLSGVIDGAVTTLSTVISGVESAIRGFIDGAVATLSSRIDGVLLAVSDAIATITGAISGATATITDALSGIASPIMTAIDGVVTTLSRTISTVASALQTAISGVVSALSDVISGVASAIQTAISRAISTLSNVISGTASSIMGAISGVISTLSGVISDIESSIMSAISDVISTLSDIISRVASTLSTEISGVILKLSDILSGIASSIISAISDVISVLSDVISGVASAIQTAISRAISTLSNVISGTASSIMGAISGAISAISDVISAIASTIMGAISGVVATLSDILSGIASAIMTAISGVIETLSAVFSAIASAIMGAISGVIETLSGIFSAIASAIMTAISGVIETLSAVFSAIASAIMAAISGVLSAIIDAISGFVAVVSEAIYGVVEAVVSAIGTFADTISTALVEHVIPAISGVYTGIISFLTAYVIPPIYNVVHAVDAGFKQLGVVITGFINAILKFPEWFPTWFKDYISTPILEGFEDYLVVPLWDGLIDRFIPQLVVPLLREVVDFARTYIRELFLILFPGDEMVKPPYGPIKSTILVPIVPAPKPIMRMEKPFVILPIEAWFRPFYDPMSWFNDTIQPFLETVREALWTSAQNLFTWILEGIAGFVEVVREGVKTIAQTVSGLLAGTLEAIWGVFVKEERAGTIFIYEEFEKFIRGVYDPMVEKTGSLTADFMKPIFEQTFKELKIESPEALTINYITKQLMMGVAFSGGVMFLPFWGQVPARFVIWMLRAFAKWAGEHDWKIRINLRPLGIGVDTEFSFAKAIGASLWDISESVKHWMDEIGRGMIYGWAIWFSRPVARIANYYFRNIIPVELPREDFIIEFARRSMMYTYKRDAQGKLTEVTPTDPFLDTLKIGKFYYSLFGYSDEALRWLFSYDLKDWVQTKDRFGYIRNFPISLMHTLPSATDLATMMVRDLFYDIENFKRIIHMRGMTEDTAYMYYFLRFRYPPPERLWQFTTRGIAGLLWATATPEELEEIAPEAKAVGAPLPVSPTELNFKATPLFNAFKTYMKWHDYARFSWIKDFPSDNLIYIDTLADIPTKIDQRWITKWGLYELLSGKGVGLESPVSEFRTKIVEAEAKSEIRMDLTLFARTLQATGLHPDWVPLTAVAEAINALTDERTLLRTGFMSLFKEGFWDVGSLETLLAGIVMASFQVSYFDMAQMKWGTGWINHPVMFLPAERKLLELRALMDRSLDILRETQRDISRGYSEWIVETYEEYKGLLTKIIEQINTFFSADYKEITGLALPEKLQLQFVEAYYKPYVASLDIWRDIYTVRRVRYWTQRWLGWIMYRVATGVVKREDMEQLITYVVKYAKLTKYEEQFFNGILDIMYKMAVREYIPTPTMLATLSEYMVIPTAMVEKAFTDRLVPEEWRPIWGKYIEIRPVADDIKALLTTYRRALLYAVIPDEIKNAVENYAKLIGFTDREWAVLHLRVALEELILQSKEYIPTPMMLATISEYVPRAREFFDEVMKARRVPKEWIPIWAEYVDLRPIISEVRRLISRAEDLYTYFAVTQEAYKKVLGELGKFGYTVKELELMLTSANYERQLRAWRECIGDVDRMVMLSEYAPKAREYALGQLHKMVDALPIPQETKKLLIEMWEQFIRLRPVMDEVRRYITELIADFAEGIITEEEYVAELEALKEWGLDDFEVMFYKAIGGMRRARYLARKARAS